MPVDNGQSARALEIESDSSRFRLPDLAGGNGRSQDVLRLRPAVGNTQRSRSTIKSILTFAFAIALGLLLAGCDPAPPKAPESIAMGITGYNFTDEGVQRFFVDGMYGSNLPPYGGGGKTSCCANLPEKWSPGLFVKVAWTMGDWTVPYEQIAHLTTEEQLKCCWRVRSLSKTVPVERYEEELGKLQVFFLPDDQIKVWVYPAGPQNPRHPSRMGYPQRPSAAPPNPATKGSVDGR